MSVGDKVFVSLTWNGFWNMLAVKYNETAVEQGWNTIAHTPPDETKQYGDIGSTNIECTVKGMLS